MQRRESVHDACDQMQKQFLLNLFDVIDEDGSGTAVAVAVIDEVGLGEIDDDALGLALERAGVTVDAETLAKMIQVFELPHELVNSNRTNSSVRSWFGLACASAHVDCE